jgi:hypothetical protein
LVLHGRNAIEARSRPDLDPGGDVDRMDAADRRHVGDRAPSEEFIGGA